jgi:hypothetical protein
MTTVEAGFVFVGAAMAAVADSRRPAAVMMRIVIATPLCTDEGEMYAYGDSQGLAWNRRNVSCLRLIPSADTACLHAEHSSKKERQLRLALEEGRLSRPASEETTTVPYRHTKRLRPGG